MSMSCRYWKRTRIDLFREIANYGVCLYSYGYAEELPPRPPAPVPYNGAMHCSFNPVCGQRDTVTNICYDEGRFREPSFVSIRIVRFHWSAGPIAAPARIRKIG
jgi:hypothetical protein